MDSVDLHYRNLGDAKTTITIRPAHARTLVAQVREAAGLGEGLLRVAAGLEAASDIKADLARGAVETLTGPAVDRCGGSAERLIPAAAGVTQQVGTVSYSRPAPSVRSRGHRPCAHGVPACACAGESGACSRGHRNALSTVAGATSIMVMSLTCFACSLCRAPPGHAHAFIQRFGQESLLQRDCAPWREISVTSTSSLHKVSPCISSVRVPCKSTRSGRAAVSCRSQGRNVAEQEIAIACMNRRHATLRQCVKRLATSCANGCARPRRLSSIRKGRRAHRARRRPARFAQEMQQRCVAAAYPGDRCRSEMKSV